jgi:hypothetical protein
MPDGLDGATGCPVPGSGVGLGTVAPCGPYVPFVCDVANADLGAQDEAFEQGGEGRGLGRGRVVVDEIGGRGGRSGEEEDVVEDAALLARLSRKRERVGQGQTWACRNAL